MDWSYDSGYFATGGVDKKIILWDPKSSKPTHYFQKHTDTVECVKFNPYQGGSTHLASASRDTTVRLWDLNYFNKSETILKNHSKAVTSISFSSRLPFLVSVSKDKNAYLCKTSTPKRKTKLPKSTSYGEYNYVSWSKQGHWIGCVGESKHIAIWKWNGNRAIFERHIENHKNLSKLNSVNWSSSEDQLITSCEDGVVRIFDTLTGKLEEIISGHQGNVFEAHFSPDFSSSHVASVSADSTLQVCRLQK